MARGDTLLIRVGGGNWDFLDWLGRNRSWERAEAGPQPAWRSWRAYHWPAIARSARPSQSPSTSSAL